MSRRHTTAPRRPMPAWLMYLLVALGISAITANVAWLVRRPQLAPMPPIAVEGLEPEVAAIIETAMGNVQANATSAQAWGDLGSVLRAHDLGQEANICLANAEQLDRSDYRWPYLLGVSLTTTDADAALACFRRAAVLATDKPHVQLRLAEALAGRGLSNEAGPIVEGVLASRPKEPHAQLIKARLLLEQGQLEESHSWAEKSAASAPEKRATHLLLVQVCRRLGDKAGQERAEAALAELPDGLTGWPDPDLETVMALRRDRKWRIMAAEQKAASGQVIEATAELAQLVQDGDPSASAAITLVKSYLDQKEFGKAEAALVELLRQHGDNEKLHVQLGIACLGQEHYESAAEAFRRAIVLKHDHVAAHYYLGYALRMAGDSSKAIDAFAAAVRLSPGYASARIDLAELLLAAGNRDEALRHLEVALRLAPQNPRAQELRRQIGSEDN